MTTTSRSSAIDRLPTNRSFFLPVQSEFVVHRLPDVEFFCQAVELPGVSMRSTRQFNPFVDIKHAGDVVDFNEFQVTFKVDELLKNYMAIFDWVVRLGFPETHDQYLSLSENPIWTGEGLTSDCSVLFLNSRGKPQVEAVFRDAFPVSVSNLRVDSTANETQFLTVQATFAYTHYTMSNLIS